MRGELLVARVGHVVAFRPTAHRFQIDVHERRHVVAPGAERDRLLDLGKELELVLDVLRGEKGAVREPADILGPIDDLEMPVIVDEARVAGVHPTVGSLGLRGRLGVLVVLVKDAGAAVEHLAVVADLQLHPGSRSTHGV